jgi:hypothetical protein
MLAEAKDDPHAESRPAAGSVRQGGEPQDKEPAFAPLPATLKLPHIERDPDAPDFKRFYGQSGPLQSLPKYDTNNPEASVDLRSRDASALDLRTAGADLTPALFDSLTIWPPMDRMPPEYDPARVLEMGKNPGLGIRRLHAQGITGRGVAIAIVDQTLLTRHVEYAGRLQWYEEIGVPKTAPSEMHSPAVASLAVGKTVGVAPGADLFYIGCQPRSMATVLDFYTQGLKRLLEVDARLPKAHRIRAISISIGYGPETPGYSDFVAAVRQAEAQGVFVTWCGDENVRIVGLSIAPAGDRDDFQSYRFPAWMVPASARVKRLPAGIYVPMDARTTASPTGVKDYAHYGLGGPSWTVPYLAGAYALAAQVAPDITPKRFRELAVKTGRTIQTTVNGQPVEMGAILDVPALIQALREGKP